MSDQLVEQVQIAFAGVDPSTSPDKLQDGAVSQASNIDFALEPGAATVRLGCSRVTSTALGTGPVRAIYRHYKNAVGSSVFYVRSGSVVYRGAALTTQTAITTLTGTPDDRTAFTSFHDYCWIAADQTASCLKDNGTTATPWILSAPAAAPISPTPSYGTAVNIGGTLTGTYTATQDGSTYKLSATASYGTYLDLSKNGSNDIDGYGSDVLWVTIDKPQSVLKIWKQYALDTGGTFSSYWSAEIDPKTGIAPAEVDYLPKDYNLFGKDLERYDANPRYNARYGGPSRTPSWFSTTYITPRDGVEGRFTPEGTPGAAFNYGWQRVYGVRIVAECTEAVKITFGSWGIYGDSGHPLSDTGLGYRYRETFAVVDTNSYVLQESGPSPESVAMFCNKAAATVTSTNTHTGTTHGITHRILYRQGGVMKDYYAVSTLAYSTTVATFTDTTADLVAVINNNKIDRDVSVMPSNVVAVSEPFYNHLVVGYTNKIAWTKVGEYGAEPGKFPSANMATVSHAGDEVYGLVVWPPGLIIVNRDSVYEMYGQVFDGDPLTEQDWVLQKTGSRHGSKASRAIIKTPYGIPLVEYDALYMYVPGQGTDMKIDWIHNQIGDAWNSEVAIRKGNRIPYINKNYLRDVCATFRDDRLYLGMPTGANTAPSTLFVIDFRLKQCWWHSYPFNFNSIFYDFVDDAMYVGTTDGYVMKVETGYVDTTTAGALTGITYSLRSKSWTSPSDAVLENVSMEYKGGLTLLKRVEDDAVVATVGTATASSNKDWLISPMSGTVGGNVAFELSGVHTDTANPAVFYGVRFDALVEPKRVQFFRAPHEVGDGPGEKLWDGLNTDIEVIGTGSVYGTLYVDNTALLTQTITGPTNGRDRYRATLPGESYGDVAYAVYTSSGTVRFKLWKSRWDYRPEPPRVNSWRTDIESLEENYCEGMDADINPNGTVLSVVYVDNTATTTATFTGTNRQSYTHAIPQGVYGRTLYVLHTGTSFKHYKTWFHLRPEPDRWDRFETPQQTYPTSQDIKTWVVDFNPLGGISTGSVVADGTAIATATFTGSRRSVWNVGLDFSPTTNTQSAIDVYATYQCGSGQKFKHYATHFETTPKPFGKKSWGVRYSKLGGATQLDLARFWAYDIEASGTATLTSVWSDAGGAVSTNTITVTNRQYVDQVPLQPGMRGYIFQQKITSSQDFRVWRSSLDIERVGVKGLSRVTIPGTPQE